jgi:nucleoside 2-deoxyribosyltransferase
MKIYFAGSIRGGRDDAALYGRIIALLRAHGEVLTEHVGDVSLGSGGQSHLPSAKIYEQDTAWIREADVLVAEVTTPSLGVGYEIGLAESLGKKILCLYRTNADKKLSAMIAGNQRPAVFEYQTIEDIAGRLADFFK